MPNQAYLKRLKKPVMLTVGGATVVSVFESVALSSPVLGTVTVDDMRKFIVLPYQSLDISAGIDLVATCTMSGNNIIESKVPIVFKTSTDPSTVNVWYYTNWATVSKTYWYPRAIDQTTALNAGYQFRINTADKTKLLISQTGSSTLASNLTDILSPGEWLVVIIYKSDATIF